jgi:hypothetical protein
MSFVHGFQQPVQPFTGLNVNQAGSAQSAGPAGQAQGQQVAGRGALAGRSLSLGDGLAREQAQAGAEKSRGFFKTLGLGLARGFVGLTVGLPLLAGAAALKLTGLLSLASWVNTNFLEPKAERAYKRENQTALDQLKLAPQGGLLNDVDNGTEDVRVLIQKLMAHAETTEAPITRDEIVHLVNTGEHIAKALAGPDGNQLPLKVVTDWGTHEVKSSAYTARALSWFMMAKAAQQDTLRDPGDTTSDMATSGAFVMKDPGNRLYNFLSACPTAGTRMSTHFAERVGHNNKHQLLGSSLFATDKPAQRGIEDYQNKMPGKGGTMLFDKLKPDSQGNAELFVKFEGVGCPPFFKSDSHEGWAHRGVRFFAALDRNIGHSISFLQSRSASPASGASQVVRMEHAYKGTFKTLYQEFSALAKDAHDQGLVDDNAKAIGKSVHKFGLPSLKKYLGEIRKAAQGMANESIEQRAQSLLDQVQAESERLGAVSDRYGIERRGAEVHLQLV